jgi:peptidoglycan/xylan/chitin deacetylase (PgdA/CDA1 family)
MTAAREPHIPVVMYHTVGHFDPDWLWGDLTMPRALFAGQLDRLSARGYRPVTLDEVHESRVAGETVRDRRVVLTFDDGYLDNWVFVYPLLKRAGWRGLVYVNPEFVDPGTEPRPNLEDVWSGRCDESDLQTRGFLNWAELEIMDRSGILQAGCHSMSHTWYPCGPEIVDFHRPNLSTPWLAWNARPDRKSFYLSEDQTGFVPFGAPIQRNGRSLGIRRYFADPAQTEAAVAHVAAHGGAAFFEGAGCREELLAVARTADGGKGRHETDEEMLSRYRYEIEEAKRILEQRLNHPVLHFCWPGGAYNDASWDIATKAGFRTITVKRGDPKRWPDPAAHLIRRISNHQQFSLFGKCRATDDPEMLVLACEMALGRRGARMAHRVRKVLNAMGLIRPAG